jgi:hypothetical protein
MNHIKLYYIEKYLFEDVRCSFEKNGKLNAFDFFCIVIWKANRAKSKIAKTLIKNYKEPQAKLNTVIQKLTSAVASAPDDKTRMKILIEEWGLLLPMASAVLTVLYPDNFTVYDVRVCGEIKGYHKLKNIKKIDRLWEVYEKYTAQVKKHEPDIKSLRDKDRALWAKSFEKQLKNDIKKCFRK